MEEALIVLGRRTKCLQPIKAWSNPSQGSETGQQFRNVGLKMNLHKCIAYYHRFTIHAKFQLTAPSSIFTISEFFGQTVIVLI